MAQLVHVIQGKLKGHFSQSGKQSISLPCLESLFFGVFEGHIHHFNYQSKTKFKRFVALKLLKISP